MASAVNLSVGTASFQGAEKLQKALDTIRSLGISEIDTAEIYGNNEADLGKVQAATQGFVLSTKNPGGFGTPSLTPPELLREKTAASLARLVVDQVDILYIHAPVPSLQPADYAHTFDEMYRAGSFRRFGISNFTPEETRALYDYCKEHGLVLPTVYQGNYNPVSRLIEADLFPVLRELGISFYAYSPTAGGFLTKTRKAIAEDTVDGRFDANSDHPVIKLYRGFYLKPAMLEGLAKWEELAELEGVSQAELAYRWVAYHSKLEASRGDTIILGASKIEQLTQTVGGLQKGPLKHEVVRGIDEVWENVRAYAISDNFHG